MLFAWRKSCETNLRQLNKLLFANTYEFLPTKAPKRQIGLPTVVKITCSPLPFFSPLNWYIPKSVKALSFEIVSDTDNMLTTC